MHDCLDWTTTPPTRKIPLLILTRGDDHVYTFIPNELKTLEEVARKEFHLGDVDVQFSSSCASLCHGQPARITENAWEYLSPYIGCATVAVQADAREPNAKRKSPSDANDQHDQLNARATPAADAASDHFASAPEDEEPWEGEIPPRPHVRRRVVSQDEPEREPSVPARSPLSPAASPPSVQSRHPSLSNEVKKERLGDYRPLSSPFGKEIEKEGKSRELGPPSTSYAITARESGNASRLQPSTSRQSMDGSHGQAHPHSETEYDTQTQTELGENDNSKLMIRVAHRPSKQESKFMTKATTKVAKVLAGACKSFGLDISRTSMYLIVLVEDEDGQEVENLFPCDKSDTIARAGAECDTESRFLLKMDGEA